jgi:hypothetical protein
MLPEFTAEAALDERSAHYRMGGGPALGSLVDSSALVPQQAGAAAFGCTTIGPWTAGPLRPRSSRGC